MGVILHTLTWKELLLVHAHQKHQRRTSSSTCAAHRPWAHRSRAPPAEAQAGQRKLPAHTTVVLPSILIVTAGEREAQMVPTTRTSFPWSSSPPRRHSFPTCIVFFLLISYLLYGHYIPPATAAAVARLSTFLSVCLSDFPSLPLEPFLLTGAGLGVINYWDGFM